MPPRPKYPILALLCLLFAGTESSGKIALSIRGVVVFERKKVIEWTRSAEDPTDFGLRTVPSTDIQVGDLQPEGTGLSGTVVVLFEESSDGITKIALEAFDKSDPNDILFESTPFSVRVSSVGDIGKEIGGIGSIGGSGSKGGVSSSSGTSDTTASSATTATATSAPDSASSGTLTEPGTPTSSSARFTTSFQVAGAKSQNTFISSVETQASSLSSYVSYSYTAAASPLGFPDLIPPHPFPPSNLVIVAQIIMSLLGSSLLESSLSWLYSESWGVFCFAG
ncbi:hypothetical protein C8J56DRAFT_210947 [Mycena floridula]|nr:hypothetical protein C8J56DRAFT_210947 [Mycena floridula]